MKAMDYAQRRNSIASLLLRVGLAGVLLYAGVSSFVSPAEWLGYLPRVLTSHFAGNSALDAVALYELLLAGWLLSGRYLRYAAGFAALTFVGIIGANLAAFSTVTFRDVPMVFAALALLVMAW